MRLSQKSTPGPQQSNFGQNAPQAQKWPDRLWLVRHGQSAGNVARDAAESAQAHWIDIATRDVDTPLSDLGERQSRALGGWFAALPDASRPNVVLSSPYARSMRSAELIVKGAVGVAGKLEIVADERLREKEFGILDRMTVFGIKQTYPSLSEQRQHVGKFYFRPPGGESWCDVILRLRSVLDTLTREYSRQSVLIVAHQVVVNCFRYLFERMTEAEVLAIDREGDVPNCGVTYYEFDPTQGSKGKLTLRLANFVAPLLEGGAAVTSAPDVPAAPKS
jgi:broad specificity phosphatase PhoE